MPTRRAREPVTAERLRAIARRLLSASTLCSIATVSRDGRPHINTAYFVWGTDLQIVWLSEPAARHSRNLESNPAVAIAVYDSTQTWGGRDRGIQLFGNAREVSGRTVADAYRLYSSRFRDYSYDDLRAYRLYRFRPRTLKLFHERDLGAATFVTATVGRGGRLVWKRTEAYVGRS